MSNRIPISAFRLALHHHHGWAEIIQSQPKFASRVFEQRDGLIPDDIIRDVTQQMKESDYDLGLLPAYTHTTGTGRTVWLCLQHCVTLEIHRPISIVARGVCGSLGVLRLSFGTNRYGLMDPKYAMSLDTCDYAETRHYAELLTLVQVLGMRELIPETPHADEIYNRILAGMDCESWEDEYAYGVITPWAPSMDAVVSHPE